MNVVVSVRTYRGGAAHRWHRLSGKGSAEGPFGCMAGRFLTASIWCAPANHFSPRALR
jgi:hypothetical protein